MAPTVLTATFDTLSEGYTATTLTDGGITFSNLSRDFPPNTPDNPNFTIDAIGNVTSSDSLGSFASRNILSFGGYVPGNGYAFDRFGSMTISAGGQKASSASLEVFSDTFSSPNNTLTLEALLNGVVVATDSSLISSFTPITPGGFAEHRTFGFSNIVFDQLLLVSSGPNNNGAVFLGIDNVSLTLTGTAQNKPPTITLPTSPTVSDGIPSLITGINVGDPSGTAEKLSLSVSHGTLTFGTTTGLTVTGNGTKSITVTGTLADLQTDLATLSYTGKAPYNGTDTLSLGLTDTTDKLTTKTSLAITDQYNPPTITLPTSPTVTAGTGTLITGITVGDKAGTAEKLALSVGHGTLTFGTKTGLTVTSGSYGSKSVTVTGTLADLQTDLATLSYTGSVSYKGKDTLSLGLTDTTDNLITKSSLAFTVVPATTIEL